MPSLVWDEGMSVGIDTLDDDHKKIIAILAELLSAAHDKVSSKTIEEIFTELEHYVVLHFQREEELLTQINFTDLDNHKKSHQAFIDKIPELKQEWLAKDSFETAEKITYFLQQWIVNHILVEDLDYVKEIFNQQNQEKTQYNLSLVQQFSQYLSSRLKLSQRVFLTTLLPIVGVLALCVFVLSDNYQRYKNMSLLLGLNNVIEQVNSLTHSLQAERGLSSGFASSNYQHFINELKARRFITDGKIKKFLHVLKYEIDDEVTENIVFYLKERNGDFSVLLEHRKQLDNKELSFEQTNDFYSQSIAILLSLSENLTHVDMSSQLANDISAINSVLLFKEFMGQIRAEGMAILEQGSTDLYSHANINILLGQQQNAMRVFNHSASKVQRDICADFCDSSLQKIAIEADYGRTAILAKDKLKSYQWFKLMSDRINELHKVSDLLIADLNRKILLESQYLKNVYYAILFLFLVFLFFAIIFSLVLNHSIISPVQQVTQALNKMAEGDRHIQFKEHGIDDEISAMHLAYEKLRRKLLQADIFQAMVSRQQKSLQYRKSQQEHFQQLALTDALTGAVNRHRFNKVMSDEITNVNIYGTPLSILLLDIDFFKKINDTYGHVIGDEVLVAFYQSCKESVRSTDIVARIGGEEFVIVMPNTSIDSATIFAERLREKIANLKVEAGGEIITLTVSIGVAQWNKDTFSKAEHFIEHTDKLLYQAKHSGRNKVIADNIIN